jgi:hypothetical protein
VTGLRRQARRPAWHRLICARYHRGWRRRHGRGARSFRDGCANLRRNVDRDRSGRRSRAARRACPISRSPGWFNKIGTVLN